jgi:hypothetical protein
VSIRSRLAAAGLTLAAVASALAGPAAPASAANSTFFFTPLQAPVNVPATVSDAPMTTILSVQLTMQAGQKRRVQDQLDVTISSGEGAEVRNRIFCFGPNGFEESVANGANHRGSGAGMVRQRNALLLVAPVAGTYTCELRVFTGDGDRFGFHITALPSNNPFTNGTWLHASAAGEVNAQWMRHHVCDSQGTARSCVYIGSPGDALSYGVFVDGVQDPNPHLFTARDDSATLEVVGNYQVTSCTRNTRSCRPEKRGGGGDSATFFAHMQFNQLNPDGSICRLHFSDGPARAEVLLNDVHHLPLHFHATVPVSPNCNGSRMFRPEIRFSYVDGHPIKLDGGEVVVLDSVQAATTTTVPNVLGAGEAQASTTILNAGLVPRVIRELNPAPSGTVFRQNSPGGTVEPTGSIVDLHVSQGQAVVPNVMFLPIDLAIDAIESANLVVRNVSVINNCIDPGSVRNQNPDGGTVVPPGSPVDLTVSSCEGPGEPV